MHVTAVPKRSGVHRFACLALYRALLRRCSPTHSNNNAPWVSQIKSLAQKRFRRYKTLQSPSQVQNALKAGYQTYDLLESALKGNQQHVQQLIKIQAEANAIRDEKAARLREFMKLKPPSPPSPKQLRKQKAIQAQEATQRRHPDARSILERPNLAVSNKRRIPVLVNARGVPFLRIKKPQPRNLSGVIRNLLERRWRKIETRTRLSEELIFAQDEDAWDKLTSSASASEPSWAAPIKTSINEANQAVNQWDERRRDMAEKMWSIVVQERELAAQEEEQRRAEAPTPSLKD